MPGATFVSTLSIILDVIEVTELDTGTIVLRRVMVKVKRIHKTIGNNDLFSATYQKKKYDSKILSFWLKFFSFKPRLPIAISSLTLIIMLETWRELHSS